MTNQTVEEQDYKEEIEGAVENGSDIVFIFYSLVQNSEENARFALTKILEKYKREEWFTPIFSCLKELTTNAMKANAKKILIDEGVIKGEDSVIDIIKKIRTILNERAGLEYGIKTKTKKLSTRVYFKMQPQKLIIQVINNLPIYEKELRRITDRIEKSSKFDSLAEIYLEYPDPEAEGMGLGLSMVVTLLKSIDVDYHNFTVTTDGIGKTNAQMIIPFG